MINQMIVERRKLTRTNTPIVVDYLAKSFPEKPMPAAGDDPGAVEASIKEWTVPTPAPALMILVCPDGMVWYTGNASNLLGRFDPKTGEFKEYHLKTPHSGPHGLVSDKDGNIWFTANQAAYVGKLDPKTGEVTEYKMPEPARLDPHTPIFDHNGTLWFTLQGSNMVGRLIPKTGEVKLVTVPTPRSQPYGMVVNSKGIVLLRRVRHQQTGKIDPARWKFANLSCRTRRPGLAASPSAAMMFCGTRTLLAAIWGGSIPRLARTPSGFPRAAPNRKSLRNDHHERHRVV